MDAGGGIPWGQLGYADVVGLQMNAGRMALRRVYYDALASALAAGIDDVPRPVIEAACPTTAAADRLEFEVNAARHRAAKGW